VSAVVSARGVTRLASVVAVIGAIVVPASAAAQGGACDAVSATSAWTGQGATASWSDAANRSTGQPPTAADVVCIAGDGVAAVLDTGAAVVGSIDVGLGASLSVVNASLEMAGPGPSTLAHLVADNGTLGGVGARTVTGLLDLRRGVLTGSATTAVVIREGGFGPVEGLDALPDAEAAYSLEGVSIVNEP
jgi:hypothetical protein